VRKYWSPTRSTLPHGPKSQSQTPIHGTELFLKICQSQTPIHGTEPFLKICQSQTPIHGTELFLKICQSQTPIHGTELFLKICQSQTPIHETELFLKIWQLLSQSRDFYTLYSYISVVHESSLKQLFVAIFRKSNPGHILFTLRYRAAIRGAPVPQVSGTPTYTGRTAEISLE
jgi:hypothetical protein